MFVIAIHMGALLCLSKSVLTGDDWRLSPHRPQPIKNHAKFYQVGGLNPKQNAGLISGFTPVGAESFRAGIFERIYSINLTWCYQKNDKAVPATSTVRGIHQKIGIVT